MFIHQPNTKSMHQTQNTLPPTANIDPAQERLSDVPPEVSEAIGQTALSGEEIAQEAALGISEIDAHLGRITEDGSATLIRDVEDAHEAAFAEQQERQEAGYVQDMAEAHEAALAEQRERQEASYIQDIAAAREAADQEGAEREAIKAAVAKTLAEAAAKKSQSETVEDDGPQQTGTFEPAPAAEADPTQNIRTEAAAILNEAGISSGAIGASEVSKDTKGNIFIVGDTDAKVITPSRMGGKPKITRYHFEKGAGDKADTLTIDGQSFDAFHGPANYQATELNNMQTDKEVITLPNQIARRFGGIERVIAAK
jgi:hypothetical protein